MIRSPHFQAGSFALILGVVLLLPGGAMPPVPTFDWFDKAAHFGAFLCLTVLTARSFRALPLPPRPVLSAALITLAYAVSLELLQGLIPGRLVDVWDLVANGLGIVAGFLLQTMAHRG